MWTRIVSFLQAIVFTAGMIAALVFGPLLGGFALVGFTLWLAYKIFLDHNQQK